MDLNKSNLTMEPIIELIWAPEEEELEITPRMGVNCLEGLCACMSTGVVCPPARPGAVPCG